MNCSENYSNPLQLAEYLEDGAAILNWFKKRRSTYFSTKNWELVAIEMELCTQASPANPAVYWYGFIDVVLRNTETNEILIIDIKTSRQGWNKYQKADSIKMAQLIAYKNYFSAQFGTPKEKISVEFFIVKRKIWEDSEFPIPRIQEFIPPSGSKKRLATTAAFRTFIEDCFDKEGKPQDKEYAKRDNPYCKWCQFSNNPSLCDKNYSL
jgi:Holliday junction resolvase-like predicted endonuclease